MRSRKGRERGRPTGGGEEESDVVFVGEAESGDRDARSAAVCEAVRADVLLPVVHPGTSQRSAVDLGRGRRSVRDVALVVSGKEMRLKLMEENSIGDGVVAVESNLLVPARST